jgi:hypothetical protein
MCDTNDKCGLLSSSSQDLFIDFFPPPYTTVVVPSPPQCSSRLQDNSTEDSESGHTETTSRHDRKLKIRLLLLIVVAILSLLAIVAISLQLIVRHMEVGGQLAASTQDVDQQPLLPATMHDETVIEIQLLDQESESEELSGK